jgi:hypothetical protein
MTNVQQFYTLSTDVTNNYFSGVWMLTRCLKQAGWVYKASSNGSSSFDTSGVAANDKWGGNATPTSDTYPTAFSTINGPWWVAQGPQVVKLGIANGSPATGTFTRGETVTQASSGATGELLGYVYDTTVSNNGGWVIIMPHTGTFNGTNTITGGLSSATVTPNSYKLYSQEVCIWKDSSDAQHGTIYWIMADVSAENSSLFSVQAASGASGVTFAVAPFGGGTGNSSFPTSAIAILGTGGSSSASVWLTTGANTSHALVAAANATPTSGVSADGTGWIMFSTVSGTPSSSSCYGIFRLDDTEPGDVCPFEWIWAPGGSTTSYSPTTGPNGNNSGITFSTFFGSSFNGGSIIFNGYIARGVGGTPGVTPDVSSYHLPGIPSYANFNGSPFRFNNADVIRAQNHPATIKPLGVDTVSLWNDKSGTMQSKGRIRWMRWVSVGSVFDTTDSKIWVCWIPGTSTSTTACYVGPWDGSTTPAP